MRLQVTIAHPLHLLHILIPVDHEATGCCLFDVDQDEEIE